MRRTGRRSPSLSVEASESRSREGVWWGGARSSSGARDTVRCAASLAQLMAVTSVAGRRSRGRVGFSGGTRCPDAGARQAPSPPSSKRGVGSTRRDTAPLPSQWNVSPGGQRRRSGSCRHESCVPGFLRHTILPFPLSCSYGCLSLGELSYDAAPLVPEHCLPFPSRASRGKVCPVRKDPRALLVPSYTTATTAKTAPVGLCGPV